jgi:hypothetical protein
MQQLILSVDSEIGWTLSNFPGNDFFKKIGAQNLKFDT